MTTTNQPDTPRFFNPSNTRFGYTSLIIGLSSVFFAGACGDSEVQRYKLGNETSYLDGSPNPTPERVKEVFDYFFPPEDFAEPWDENGPPIIAPWTRVFENNVLEQSLVEISDDYVTFSLSEHREFLTSIEDMDVIVSAYLDAPFLRRVVDVEVDESSNHITFYTVDTGLEAVVLAGSFSLDEATVLPTGEDLPGDLRQLHQPSSTDTMDVEEPRGFSPKTKNGFSVNFGLSLDYSKHSPPVQGRRVMEFSMTSGTRGSMCREFRAASEGKIESWFSRNEIPGESLMMMTWAVKWAGHWRLPQWYWNKRPKCDARLGDYGGGEVQERHLNWGWGPGHEKFTSCKDENYHTFTSDHSSSNDLVRNRIWLTTPRSRTTVGDHYVGTTQRNLFLMYEEFSTGQFQFQQEMQHKTRDKYDFSYIPRIPSHNPPVSARNPSKGMYVRVKGSDADNPQRQKEAYLANLTDIIETAARGDSCLTSSGQPVACITQESKEKYLEIVSWLRATPDFDSLHWIEMAPVIGKYACQGTATRARFGGGAKIKFDYTGSVKFSLGQSTSLERDPDPALKEFSPNELEWRARFAKKYFFFMIGWVPVLLSIDASWKTNVGAKLNAEYEFKFPKKTADIDFYYGFLYENGSLSWQTLQDLEGRSNRLDFNFPSLSEMAFAPGKPGASVSVGADTGPVIEVKLYETVGINLAGKIYAEGKLSATPTECKATVKAGAKLTLGGSVEIPLCPLDNCKAGASTTLYDTCSGACRLGDDDRFTAEISGLCACANLDICGTLNDAGAAVWRGVRGGSNNLCTNCSTAFLPDVNYPEGVNDVPDHLEIDALWVERNGVKILPIEVRGLVNCKEGRGTVERGCPELLWRADFTTCDPDQWQEKVGLIANLDDFRVRFRDQLQEGDKIRIIRQAVRPGDMNADGQVCRASGALDLVIGALTQSQGEVWGDVPVALGVYNSSDYELTADHLNQAYIPPVDSAWPERADDATFGWYLPEEEPQ